MMGIYIKGMVMPENCAMCPLCHRNFGKHLEELQKLQSELDKL